MIINLGNILTEILYNSYNMKDNIFFCVSCDNNF